jgi:ferredoxin
MAGLPARISYGKRSCPAEADRDLLSQLLDAGGEITYLCMAGSCGTCRVRVLAGGEHLAPRSAAEDQRLPADPELRLACQAMVLGTGDVRVVQPPR